MSTSDWLTYCSHSSPLYFRHLEAVNISLASCYEELRPKKIKESVFIEI